MDKPINTMKANLIAPCGINCRVCRFHMKAKNPCPGCRDPHLSGHCLHCMMKLCPNLAKSRSGYCVDCAEFPCALVKQLDKRYQTKYGASPIANLISIQASGITAFLESEDKKWTCPICGETLCMHHPQCLSCGYAWNSGSPDRV